MSRSAHVRVDRAIVGGVFLVAFAVRLAAVLRGGGLYGVIGYDGAVYYTVAAGLAHGLAPYRDVLLLHPPGIALALLPFAALGRLIGDPDAFAAARLAWLLLGALNAVLVVRVVRPLGRWAAVAGGLAYAVFVPAIDSEHSTSLEALGSTCLLLAVVALLSARDSGAPRHRTLFGAGLALGLSSGTKIWGAAFAVVVVIWAVRALGGRTTLLGPRRALVVLAGAAVGATLICLPFFVAAPAAMWRMVVVDQFGRRRVDTLLSIRVIDTAGLSQLKPHVDGRLLLGLVALVGTGLAVLAFASVLGRLALLLVFTATALLIATPSWSVHYTGLVAAPAALLVGAAVGELDRRLRGRAGRVERALVAATLSVAILAYAAGSLPGLTFGSRFPGASLDRALTDVSGCVTTDDPTVLIETGTLQRNLRRGCPLVADLGGYSYDLQPGAARHVGRAANGQWQRFALQYLGSGEATVIARFRVNPGYSKTTKAVIAGWPVLAAVGWYQVRAPRGAGPGSR